MKKEILTHSLYLLLFSLVVILVKRYFLPLNLNSALICGMFLLGGVIGTVLPDIDHLIYIFLLKPQDLTSQRVGYMLGKGDIWNTLEVLAITREERKHLIFHSALFQIIFWVLAFLVVSSSGSVFGRGLVLAFSLHLIVDQFLDLMKLDNLDNWFRQWNLILDKNKYMFYWITNLGVLLLFGLVF
ncbi:hypothetical protein KW795_01605 [Candidatus Microgenomates bacterium]|nr:hypothetical protein [Candidatus Microgenomates bacterium]